MSDSAALTPGTSSNAENAGADSNTAADVRERALAHIKRCDELFDGNVIRQDREFAYNQVRLLALELLEMVVESG